jgi:hypothetical protein
VNGTNDVGVSVVDRLPLEMFLVKLEDCTNIIKGFIDSLVLYRGLPFSANQLAG